MATKKESENRLATLAALAGEGKKITALTAYDYPTARLLDEAGVDLILVGDSLGMVVLGLEDTTGVDMSAMLHHIRAAARGTARAPLVGDFPFGSYDSPEMALANGRRLLEAGADAVKLEGGVAVGAQVRALVAAGIAVVGHIGMLPQQVREEGGYHKKGKTPGQADALFEDAKDLEAAGALALILEGIVADVAAEITRRSTIPTIGIGSGMECDGQILVTHDLLGSFPWFRPPFATPRADLASETTRAVREYIDAVRGE
ncbi:MAG: 3-methyl-2-oxobutanoate hydroxymethyltransferase [Verrucomicrobiales bacterium]